ncbi:MAG: polysaccharide deacetylase family protein [Alphaproteobacteria bacterium]|nr:polysaccharide deacetylase family protein [Alphaproteobacteria bacterium]MBV8549442.1 polysaccharide deacetylase family protein [Alphaproteobacteria bacterium]
MKKISFTVDLEDPYDIYAVNGRYVDRTRHILNMCDALNRKATFFTVGRVAEAVPDLIAEIAKRGHEVAYHSHAHVSLTKETPENFARETAMDKKLIESITGKPLTGFRAPRFSLTPQSVWVLDVLNEQGFQYSSSIMPTKLSRFGFQNVPTYAFRWPNGLVEFPLPTAALYDDFRLGYLGGIYMYLLPTFVTRYFVRKAADNEVLWTYTHPYDFDPFEAVQSMSDTPTWAMLVLRLGRLCAERKLRDLLTEYGGAPLTDCLHSVAAD